MGRTRADRTTSHRCLHRITRIEPRGRKQPSQKILQRLDALTSNQLTADQQVIAIRALSVCFMRMGRPDRATAESVLNKWEPLYPANDPRVNQSLCELLVYLDSTNVVRKTIPLLVNAKTQEEKLHYLFTLRLVKSGWALDDRRTYFDWLRRARTEFSGANMLPTALNYIRADAESTLASAERSELADVLALLNKPAIPHRLRR
jgi:hypothetical protein